jgi:DNA replication and repair protein RecF
LINKVAARSRAYDQLLVTVFFGPDELSLVKGSPDGRRKFLDDLVVKLRPARDQLRREWARVLKQRNALLKSARATGRDAESFEVWDEAFCRAGAALAGARLEALAALLPYAIKRFEEIAGRGTLELGYMSSWLDPALVEDALASGSAAVDDMAGSLNTKIESLRVPETERGMSLAGPQRDDVSVLLPAGDGGSFLDARSFASQGDQRTAALALKLAEHDLLSSVLEDRPVLLMDDVFSELDPHRRTWLAEAVREMGQTFLSSAESPGSTLHSDLVLEVNAGLVTRHG